MVAAHNNDLKAARACGLKTAFFARPYEHWDSQLTDLQSAEDWDFVASSLVELAAQMTGDA
ncbi:hypothetical protein OKW42_006711 [Paraburkholderia sp. WC7.3d]